MKIDFAFLPEIDLSNPGRWPVYYKIAAWLLCGILALLFSYHFILEGRFKKIDANDREIAKIESEYQKDYHYILELSAYQSKTKSFQNQLNQVLKHLPSQQKIAQIVDDVKVAAMANDINIAEWVPLPIIKGKYYDVVPIKLKAEAPFSEFAKFSESLSNLDHVMNVHRFYLTTDREPSADNLHIEMELRAYIFNHSLN